MGIRETGLRWVLRIGEYVRNSAALKKLLKRFGMARTVVDVYERFGQIFGTDGTVVSVADTQAVFHDELSLMHVTNERPVIADLIGRLTTDDIVYDIGAAAGLYTCLCADIVPAEQIFAFEPSPEALEVLQRNLERNDITEVHVFQCALSNHEREVSFSLAEGQIQPPNEDEADEDTVEIRTVRGDDAIGGEDFELPTVVKIDVEGAEARVLRGLRQHLSRPNCRLVYCEVHPAELEQFGASAGDIEDILQRMGFAVERITESEDGRYTLRGEKVTILRGGGRRLSTRVLQS